MQKVELILILAILNCLVPATAITIEEMAEKNNRLIELDQDIAIAEKSKKLAELKSSSIQPDAYTLPQYVAAKPDDTMSVLAVHGAPDNPIVDIQFGETLLQKHRGETVPDGWSIAAIGKSSVTFSKKTNRKIPLTKTVGIGQGLVPEVESSISSRNSVPVPIHSFSGK